MLRWSTGEPFRPQCQEACDGKNCLLAEAGLSELWARRKVVTPENAGIMLVKIEKVLVCRFPDKKLPEETFKKAILPL